MLSTEDSNFFYLLVKTYRRILINAWLVSVTMQLFILKLVTFRFLIMERIIVLCVYAVHACSFNYKSDYGTMILL